MHKSLKEFIPAQQESSRMCFHRTIQNDSKQCTGKSIKNELLQSIKHHPEMKGSNTQCLSPDITRAGTRVKKTSCNTGQVWSSHSASSLPAWICLHTTAGATWDTSAGEGRDGTRQGRRGGQGAVRAFG